MVFIVFQISKHALKEHNHKIEEKKDYPIDLHTLERIIITPNAKGYISTAFLEYAKKYAIPIYWIEGNGMIESCFMPVYFKRTSLIIKQCEQAVPKRFDIVQLRWQLS